MRNVTNPRIAVMGRMRSGKTTLSEMLSAKTTTPIYSFAEDLKHICHKVAKHYGDDIYDKDKMRWLYQNVATEVKALNNDIWVDGTLDKISKGGNGYIIDDLRYFHEYKSLLEFGCDILVYLEGGTYNGHESENQFDQIYDHARTVKGLKVVKVAATDLKNPDDFLLKLFEQNSECKYEVVGAPGVGKTTFLKNLQEASEISIAQDNIFDAFEKWEGEPHTKNDNKLNKYIFEAYSDRPDCQVYDSGLWNYIIHNYESLDCEEFLTASAEILDQQTDCIILKRPVNDIMDNIMKRGRDYELNNLPHFKNLINQNYSDENLRRATELMQERHAMTWILDPITEEKNENEE